MYKKFADKPKNWDPADALLYQFSYKAREQKEDCSIGMCMHAQLRTITHQSAAHIMANVMAVALGSPRDSNHIYQRVFDIKQAASSYCPGSSLDRKMSDSGVCFVFILLIFPLTS